MLSRTFHWDEKWGYMNCKDRKRWLKSLISRGGFPGLYCPEVLLLRQNTFWVKSKINEVIQAAAKATQNGGLWNWVTRANADKIMY